MSRKDPERQKVSSETEGLNRRSFITTTGAGAMGVAAAGTLVTAKPAAPQAEILAATEKVKLTLKINGRPRDVLVEPRWSLLHVLREEFNLTGTKVGCDRGGLEEPR